MCVPEACDCRDFGGEVGADVWNPGTNSENASERLCSKFESVGTPAHMNVQV